MEHIETHLISGSELLLCSHFPFLINSMLEIIIILKIALN